MSICNTREFTVKANCLSFNVYFKKQVNMNVQYSLFTHEHTPVLQSWCFSVRQEAGINATTAIKSTSTDFSRINRSGHTHTQTHTINVSLCNVFLSGWTMNVPNHTLHHPFNSFVHPLTGKKMIKSIYK